MRLCNLIVKANVGLEQAKFEELASFLMVFILRIILMRKRFIYICFGTHFKTS